MNDTLVVPEVEEVVETELPNLNQKMSITDVLRSADPARQVYGDFSDENDGYCALGAIINVTER